MMKSNYNGALQKPIGSGFNATSTTSDVIKGINLAGKIAIVTGASTGIGLETVKTLAIAGATVIVPVRNIEKAQEIEVQLRANDQELKQKSDYLSTELSQQVWTRLNKYMTDYGQANNYKIIFGTQGNGNVMYAEEGLDVTNDFLLFANNNYEGN